MWRLPARFCRPLLPQIWTRHALLRMCSLLVSINAHWSAGLRPYPLDQARAASAWSARSTHPLLTCLEASNCSVFAIAIGHLNAEKMPFFREDPIRHAYHATHYDTVPPTLHGRSRFVIAANGRATIPVPNPSLQPITDPTSRDSQRLAVPLNAERPHLGALRYIVAMLPAIPSIEISHQIRVSIAGDDQSEAAIQRPTTDRVAQPLWPQPRESTPFTGWWSRRPSGRTIADARRADA